jgi:hypothetical protein
MKPTDYFTSRRLINYVLLNVALFSLISCSTVETLYKYDTFVEPQTGQNLAYSDSILKFEFVPAPNGIYFQIENLTNKNIFLVWDGTYFITPNGNSSKALNTDILNTEQKLVDKENYESIIPSKSKFLRFTTPISNLSVFQNVNSLLLYNELFNSLNNLTIYNEVFVHNSYWPSQNKLTVSNKKDRDRFLDNEIKGINNLIESLNNVGIGFTIKVGDVMKEYHFKIKIQKITMFLKDTSDIDYYTFTKYMEIVKK